jgi:hypothetical protein
MQRQLADRVVAKFSLSDPDSSAGEQIAIIADFDSYDLAPCADASMYLMVREIDARKARLHWQKVQKCMRKSA